MRSSGENMLNLQTQQNPKVKRIIQWREYLETLPDERFFEIIRIYLGEIHTPFNKQNLIERLSSIFRKEQNKNVILSFLSDLDIKVISLILYIENLEQASLIDFFKSEYSLSDIYSELLNLNERLIIWTYKNPETNKVELKINPLLEDVFIPYCKVQSLLPIPTYSERTYNASFVVSPLFIASFASYIYENPEMCKNSFSIKKKNLEQLETIFPEKKECLEHLLKAFFNLSLIKQNEKGIFIDEDNFLSFSKLEHFKQCAFLAVAATIRLSRENLRQQAQILLNVATSIPKEGFSKTSIIRMAFLLNKKKNGQDSLPTGRFSRMIQSYYSKQENIEYNSDIFENIFECAKIFGIFEETGKSSNNEKIFCASELFLQENESVSASKKGLLNINAGTNITILPGLKLKELMPLILFMNIKSCSTVSEFEITRTSISRAFDKNYSSKKIIELLEEFSSYKIPQILSMNIEEWQNAYSSAMLFSGFVLKVNEKNELLIENNPKIKKHIYLKLAPGVFLLDSQPQDNVVTLLKSLGLEFLGNIKTAAPVHQVAEMPLLKIEKSSFDFSSQEDEKPLLKMQQDANAKKNSFIKKLSEMNLSAQQKECLELRIKRNIILNEEQLKPETVRFEILEADGINYSGKIHLIENAIEKGDLIEIVLQSEKNPKESRTFLGKPLALSKQTSDTILKLQIEQTEEIKFFSVSKASHIKIIRTSVF